MSEWVLELSAFGPLNMNSDPNKLTLAASPIIETAFLLRGDYYNP